MQSLKYNLESLQAKLKTCIYYLSLLWSSIPPRELGPLLLLFSIGKSPKEFNFCIHSANRTNKTQAVFNPTGTLSRGNISFLTLQIKKKKDHKIKEAQTTQKAWYLPRMNPSKAKQWIQWNKRQNSQRSHSISLQMSSPKSPSERKDTSH